jgi:hypothetical protein
VRATKSSLVFHLETREKRVLVELLKLYPRIPTSYRRAPRQSGAAPPEASRKLLEESLAEQRAANQKQVRAWLNDQNRFEEDEAGCLLSFSPSQLEWLLQVLNDVRVGSWIILGSPEETREPGLINEKTAPHFWAMDVAGMFQMQLLNAIEGKEQ